VAKTERRGERRKMRIRKRGPRERERVCVLCEIRLFASRKAQQHEKRRAELRVLFI
jgi:hypothetical protein